LSKATDFTEKYGGIGVFFSRWLISPLGPYVNIAAGATHMKWLTYSIWEALGKAVWVLLYVGLGYAFAGQIGRLAAVLGNASGILAAVVILLGLGIGLRYLLKQRRQS